MNIYLLKNFTLKEQYLGATEEDTHAAVKAHKTNPDSPVSHWKWNGEQKIQWGEVQAGLPAGYGLTYLAALRREEPDPGWINVFGGDDLNPPDEDSAEEDEWMPPPED